MTFTKEQNQHFGDNYHCIFEQATDAIMVTDYEGNFKDANSSFCALFGYAKDELLGINVRHLVDEEHLRIKPLQLARLAVGENTFNERKMLHRDGTIIYVEANAKKINDHSFLVIARNITERKEVDEVLKQSEANLHTIFDTTDTIYVLMDTDLGIISYNPRASDFAKKELDHTIEISEYLQDYFPKGKRRLLRANRNAVLSGRQVNYEVNYPQRGGSLNWYHVRMLPISKGDKNICGLMLAVSDITEKKMMEERLLDQRVKEQKRITRAVVNAQEKERTEIGLELHDNVTQLLAASRLFLSHGLKQQDCKSAILKSQEYIMSAMEEIRKLSHALVGPAQEKSMGLIVSLEKLINDIAEVKEIRICFTHTDFNEPSCDNGLQLVIYRIIQEQLNNILKYAAASVVDIALYHTAEYLVLTIADNGKGFDTSAKKKGIGLKNINTRAKMYNGLVQILSSRGNGCKIKIIFKID